MNTVSPGWTDTKMVSDEIKCDVASWSLFNRIGTPTDIADVVSFLVSSEAWWITGQNIQVNGGLFFSP